MRNKKSGIFSRIFKKFAPKENSKTQKEKKAKTIKMVACNKCHRIGVTLKKGKDSYYCVDCYDEVNKLIEKENRCQNCGDKLTKHNKYMDGMCNECKYGIDWEDK